MKLSRFAIKFELIFLRRAKDSLLDAMGAMKKKSALSKHRKLAQLRIMDRAALVIQNFMKTVLLRGQFLRFRASIVLFQNLWREKHRRSLQARRTKIRLIAMRKLKENMGTAVFPNQQQNPTEKVPGY